MFYKVGYKTEAVTKTRSIRLEDKVQIVLDTRVISDMTLVHHNRAINAAVFVSYDDGFSISIVNGKIYGTFEKICCYKTEWKDEIRIVDAISLRHEYVKNERKETDFAINEGDFIMCWIRDELVEMKVLHSSDKKLVLLDTEDEDEEIFEITEDYMPPNFSFNDAITFK
ncbi:hypothetical protein VPFG_00319 [Vibrio phage nt-1]|uniref:Uncharacterized protein n=1 Tax=Vibrio phage nt-1 TaxID=115992 RepID=R9TJN3_9CAUD|nr:hypothetical protein VPFG_00319 [Vibrio phage nt-1]AGN30317.1 hypothetical protein VPFG_00319 [Vibrio phage nt-1]